MRDSPSPGSKSWAVILAAAIGIASYILGLGPNGLYRVTYSYKRLLPLQGPTDLGTMLDEVAGIHITEWLVLFAAGFILGIALGRRTWLVASVVVASVCLGVQWVVPALYPAGPFFRPNQAPFIALGSFLSLAFAIAGGALGSRFRREEEAVEGATCPHCGYCIEHLPTNRCPECGREFTPGPQQAGGNE